MSKPNPALLGPALIGMVMAAVLLAISACSYREGAGDNPITRSFAWFSYLNGDDLRSYCKAGGPDRYRIVYNADWNEQVRTYDLTANADGGADLALQVFGAGNWLGSGVSITDPLAPWRGRAERRVISRGELRAIRDALRASGFDTPPPVGTRVRSWGFFWLVATCEGGRFRYNGWAHPSPRYDAVALMPALKAVDNTGIAFNPAREVDWRLDRDQREHLQHYQLVITPDGIKDNFTPF